MNNLLMEIRLEIPVNRDNTSTKFFLQKRF
jgi:hypothetical protein